MWDDPGDSAKVGPRGATGGPELGKGLLVSLMKPHGGWSQEALVAVLPLDRYTAE